MSNEIKGYHFCKADNRSNAGTEPPFEIGETRTLEGEIELCKRGYHGCRSLLHILRGNFLYGPVVEVAKYSEPKEEDGSKFVSQSKTLIARATIEKDDWVQFARNCAIRAKLTYAAKCDTNATASAYAIYAAAVAAGNATASAYAIYAAADAAGNADADEAVAHAHTAAADAYAAADAANVDAAEAVVHAAAAAYAIYATYHAAAYAAADAANADAAADADEAVGHAAAAAYAAAAGAANAAADAASTERKKQATELQQMVDAALARAALCEERQG